MEVTTGIREDGKTEVTVELTAEEAKKHIDGFFKELAKNRIQGFRPGKAPRSILERHFGGHNAVYAQIASDLVNDVAPAAVDSKDIIFITDPEFDVLGELKDGEGYSFKVFGEVKPELELSDYEPVQITMPPAHATDGEVELQLDALQDYYYSFSDVEDRAAEEGDYAMVEVESTACGEPFDALTSTGRMVELGGEFLPREFTDPMVGMQVGETKEYEWTPEEGSDYAQADGSDISTKVTLTKLQVKEIPELDDEFAKKVGFDDMDKLREQLRTEIENTKEQQLPGLKERRCLEQLAERLEGEVPASYISFSRQDILRDFFNNLQAQGVSFDQFLQQRGISVDEFQADLDEEAKENAEQTIALDALFRNLGLEVTEEDIEKEFALVSDSATTRKEWEKSGRMTVLRDALRRQKAAEWLIENAVVTEEDGTEAADE